MKMKFHIYFFFLKISTIRLTTSCELTVDLFFFRDSDGNCAKISPSLLNFFRCKFVLGEDDGDSSLFHAENNPQTV